MEHSRWQRVVTLYHDALARAMGDRAAFLDTACAGDETLRQEVESLLAPEQSSDGLSQTFAVAAGQLSHDQDGPTGDSESAPVPTYIGRYRILGKLGEGGMGQVYVAEDERLGRRVAVKVIRTDPGDQSARARLIREARTAANISHGSICQIFELGDWNGQPFLVLELLTGQPLTTRLAGGPLPLAEALRIARSVVDALSVLHRRGIVHRDLKPSNIFVTESGIKLLDFGLARPPETAELATMAPVTQPGMIAGTPQYAAPEQLNGLGFDVRADLFSVGVILFEMLAGRPPFVGATLAALVHAVLYETPPVLTGSAAVLAIDRVLHRALAKSPDERYASAEALAADLAAVEPLVGDERGAEARPILRMAVLPFRLLKPDADTDYLGVSFADALVTSLSGLESLVVRSSLKSAKYAKLQPDLNAIATDLAVDVVLTGSILRLHDRLRVSAELVSVPAGDTWWTQTTDVALDAIFDLQDELGRRVVASLPLTARDHSRKRQVRPADAKAFDLYLRGMQLRMELSSWHQARSFFERCLEIDPHFAPAWAERGRLDRVMGKYEDPAHLTRAETAFQRALELDPDNGAAHYYYAQFEIDLGRVAQALQRLLELVNQRRAEPQVYAALVHACRYAGLVDESVAAHQQARRLDPAVSTSVLHTYYMRGDYSRAFDEGHQSSDPFEARLLGAMGRTAEAISAARREEERFAANPLQRSFATGLRAALEGLPDEAVAALQPFDGPLFNDGEGLFYVAEIYATLGLLDRAHRMLERAIDSGFWCEAGFETDPYLAPLRVTRRYDELLARVRLQREPAVRSFLLGGGKAILGLS